MQQPPSRNPLGQPFIELQSVDSTNNYARTLLHEGLAQHGTTVIAWEQTAGKGQRGKKWTAKPGKNIMLTVVIDPKPLAIAQQFGIIAATGLASYRFFSKYAGEKTSIKWPNDLYWQDRKAGGILVESGIGSEKNGENSWKWAIAGIGININQDDFPEDLPNPVSLKQITGKDFDIRGLARELCAEMEKAWQQLLGDRRGLMKEYNEHLYKRNEKAKLKKENRVFEAVISGVTDDGLLQVRHAFEESFSFGEVEFI